MLDAAQRAELAQGIARAAQATGARPADLAAVIGYETAGTFDPWKAGPTTRWGQHHGLIQWGEPQARQYGVGPGTSISAQMDAVSRYLRDHGFRPGMNALDLYSTVNAGRPGRYGASDGYGTVASHTQRLLNNFGGAWGQLTGGAPPQTPAQPSSLAALFAPGSGASPALQSTFDPALAGFGAETAAPVAPGGPDPGAARREALLGMIGNLFV